MTELHFSEKEKEILESRGVDALILFGSRAQGESGPLSDFDFGVLVQDKSFLFDSKRRAGLYDALYEFLSSHIAQLVNIDIVFLELAPYELRAHVMKYGIPLFEARPNIFANFKATVMQQYADFAPLRALFLYRTFSMSRD